MADWLRIVQRALGRAAQQAAGLVAQIRRSVMDHLTSPDGLSQGGMHTTLDLVDRQSRALAQSLGELVATEQAGLVGYSQAAMQEVAIDLVVPEITEAIVASLAGTRLDLASKIGDNLQRELSREVQQGVLGVKSPAQVIADVRALLDGAGAGTYPARAEVIVRTEVGRAHSMATQQHLEWAQQRGVKVRKQWLHSSSRNARQAHVALSGAIVDVREPFIVGGSRLMYPRDPSGPASETVNCRCIVLPVV